MTRVTAQQVEGYFGDMATKVVAGSIPAALSAVFSRSAPDDCGSKEETYFAPKALGLKPSRRKAVVSPDILHGPQRVTDVRAA